MKKIISLIMMLVMVFSLTACGEKEKSEELDIKDLVYNYEMLPCTDKMQGEVSDFAVKEDTVYIHATEWTEVEGMSEQTTGSFFYKCGLDGGNLTKISYEPKVTDVEWLNTMEVSEDGELMLLYTCYSEETVGNRYLLRFVGPDGALREEWDIGQMLNSEELFIQDMKVDRNGNIYFISDRKIYIFDATGELMEQTEEEQIVNMIRTKDGEILVGFDCEEGYTVKKVDADELIFGETYLTEIPYYNVAGFVDGQEYDFYYADGECLYGYDLEKGSCEKKADWISCDVNSSLLGEIKVLTDNTMLIVYGRDDTDDAYGLYCFRKTDPKDVKIREMVTYCSVYADEEAKQQAVQFNKSQDKYRVIVKDYAWSENPIAAMRKDLLAGEVADIVDLSGLSSDKYVQRGIFADLYEFMEKDDEVSEDVFSSSILSVLETDGKLYCITPTCGLNALITKASTQKMGEPFTVKDLEALEKDGAKAFYMDTDLTVLMRALEMNYDEYIDWSEGTCYFEDEAFISVLEYANTYPSAEELVWDDVTKTMTDSVRRGEILCASVYNLSAADLLLYEEMFESDLSVIGFPSDTFSGSALSMDREFAISESSQHKEGAWEFLKTYLSREYVASQLTADDFLSIPVRKDSMEDKIKRITATEPYTDDFGQEIAPLSYEWGYEDIFLQIGPFQEQQAEFYRSVTEQADHRYVYDSDVMAMVEQETEDYFDGEITSEEAAANIQKRVSTYMEDYKQREDKHEFSVSK